MPRLWFWYELQVLKSQESVVIEMMKPREPCLIICIASWSAECHVGTMFKKMYENLQVTHSTQTAHKVSRMQRGFADGWSSQSCCPPSAPLTFFIWALKAWNNGVSQLLVPRAELMPKVMNYLCNTHCHLLFTSSHFGDHWWNGGEANIISDLQTLSRMDIHDLQTPWDDLVAKVWSWFYRWDVWGKGWGGCLE
jgi:hypothetical protein